MQNIIINEVNIFEIITLTIIAILLTAIIALPVIWLLYKFKIIRHFDVDFSALIEKRKEKIGTPIMGGIMFLLTILVLNIFFNLNEYIALSLILFVTASFLGGLDDALNIYGKQRKLRSTKHTLRLIKVHKSFVNRVKLLLLLPWNFYANIIHIFESNPGKGLFGHEKLAVQVIIGFIFGTWLWNSGLFENIGFVWIPIIGGIYIGVLVIIFAIITIIGMINAVNISDGMDGLSAGLLIASFTGFLIIAVLEGNTTIAILCGTVTGSLLTYLYFNVAPARVQMGDVGSYAMGALLTFVAFILGKPILLLAFGLPFVIEFLSTFIQSIFRKVFGKRLLLMAPLHHHFEMLGWGEEKVVMRFWVLALSSMLFGLWIYFL